MGFIFLPFYLQPTITRFFSYCRRTWTAVFPSGGVQHASTQETGLFVVSTQRGVVLVTTADPGALVATLVLIHAAHRF